MSNSENILHKKLENTWDVKYNNRAVKRVFKAFSEYYGEKSDEHQKKAFMYLVGALFFVFLIIVSCLGSM